MGLWRVFGLAFGFRDDDDAGFHATEAFAGDSTHFGGRVELLRLAWFGGHGVPLPDILARILETEVSVSLPTISTFYGIVIRMFFNDHSPPHFHARYGEFEATVDIEKLAVLEGDLPGRASDSVTRIVR